MYKIMLISNDIIISGGESNGVLSFMENKRSKYVPLRKMRCCMVQVLLKVREISRQGLQSRRCLPRMRRACGEACKLVVWCFIYKYK